MHPILQTAQLSPALRARGHSGFKSPRQACRVLLTRWLYLPEMHSDRPLLLLPMALGALSPR